MPRPPCCRRVTGRPGAAVFKPAGIPASELEWLVLTLDEFEALRLADLEGQHHADAAARMKISRATFGRIVESARRKVATALCRGMALEITGGSVSLPPGHTGRCRCGRCRQTGSKEQRSNQ